MRAAIVERFTGPDGVRVQTVPTPDASPDEVLIDVRAAGVGFPDLLHTRGAYQRRPELPFILGAELSGFVLKAEAATGFRPGDRVVAVSLLGAFAEVVSVPHAYVFPLPPDISFNTGAAVLTNYLTAHYAVVRRARLLPQEVVLVHGAAGGLGIASMQVAKQYGATVFAVVSSEEKAQAAHAAGADHVVIGGNFREEVVALTDGRGVDIVVDPVGGDRFGDSIRSLAMHGRHVVLGFAAGSIPAVKVNRLLLRNVDLLGIQWAPGGGITGGYARAQWDELAPLVTAGRLAPILDCVVDLEHVRDALVRIDERRAIGKIVLRATT